MAAIASDIDKGMTILLKIKDPKVAKEQWKRIKGKSRAIETLAYYTVGSLCFHDLEFKDCANGYDTFQCKKCPLTWTYSCIDSWRSCLRDDYAPIG